MKPLVIFMHCLRVFLEMTSRVIFYFIYGNAPKTVLPPIKNLLLMESATSLALKIRNKKVTSTEVVESFIERIKEVNPILNAVVDECFDVALKEAKEVDEFIKSPEYDANIIASSKPYLGVPFTTKDSVQAKGLKHTGGLYIRKDIVSEKDASCVKLFKEAGAILLGVTNVSELCMWWESANNVYGKSNNPYDVTRIVGGSSGGEGCILSACGSPMGIGADIGGSIRMPSYFNGIFGHKGSPGIVDSEGQVPEARGELLDFLSTGPMSRFATDLKPMLKVLASSNANQLNLDKQISMKKIRIFYMLDDCGNCATTPVDRELKAALMKVVEHFQSVHKVQCTKLSLKQFRRSGDIYFGKIGNVQEANTFASELTLNQGEINVWLECLKWLFRLSKHTAPALGLAVLEKFVGSQLSSPGHASAMIALEDLKHIFKETLREDGVFLFPTHPTDAPYHGQTLFRGFNFLYTGLFNVMGVPATQCPLGLNSRGLPLGIQVIANVNKDALCLSVAEEIEKGFGGWVCPSQVH